MLATPSLLAVVPVRNKIVRRTQTPGFAEAIVDPIEIAVLFKILPLMGVRSHVQVTVELLLWVAKPFDP
jgi:hypothetical protein